MGRRLRLRRGDVRLVELPKPDKRRPALVLTRPSALKFLTRVTIAPITSTIRDIPSEVVLTEDDGMKKPCAVNLDNLTTIPERLLGQRLTTLSSSRMGEVCSALNFALGCDLVPKD